MKRPTYLVIDDSLTARMMLKALLETEGARVVLEASAAAGTATALECEPDVAIVDVVLPDQDGVALCQEWQNHPSLARIPVLLISARRAGFDDRVAGLRSGAMGYIVKPFDERELLAQTELLRRLRVAQDELRQRFERALELAPVAMLLIGADGSILFANERAERLFRCAQDGLVGTSFTQRIAEEEPDRAATLARAFATGRAFEGDWVLRCSDGCALPVEIACNPIDSDGGPATLCSIVDLSERKRNERHLQQVAREQAQLNAELSRRNADLSAFAHVVSHDLKAPLRAIGSLVDCIVADHTDVLDADGRRLLELVKGRTQRMYELIAGILRYSGSGLDSEQLQDVESSDIVESVLETLAPPEHVQVYIDTPLPRVRYPRVQLHQVFQNLLTNAIQHLDKPQGCIRIRAEAQTQEIHFCVEDNGPGIPEHLASRIFEIFQTLQPRDERESTGVGLAIVRKIVEQNGGRVWVQSCPEQNGSSFRFSIPHKRDERESMRRDEP